MTQSSEDAPSRPPILGVEDAAELMTAIVTSSSDAILSITLDGIITSWNAATEDLFGYAAGEMVGKHVNNMIPDDRRDEETEILRKIMAGSRVEQYETVRLTRDRKPIDVAVRTSPIRSASGSISGASCIIRDISDRKAAERSAAFLAAIVASTSDGVVSKTLTGIITSWNKAAERIFGFTADEMINQSIRTIIPPERQSEEDDILARVLSGGLIDNFETVRLRKDGHLVEVSITVSPIRDAKGRIVGASKIVRDITSKRTTEKQLQTLLAELNHRSKNLLALIQAIARQMAGTSDQLEVQPFLDRLQSVGRNQDLLVHAEWQALPLDEVIRSQLAAFSSLFDTRITIGGPPVELSADHVQSFGMAFTELAVNASKYGALSNESGRIDIGWTTDDGAFAIWWHESEGPPVKRPSRTGFGSQVVTTMLEYSVGGSVELQYADTGLRWRLTCPLDRLTNGHDC